MKILITGGAGFIGSHLVDRLIGEITEYRQNKKDRMETPTEF